MGVPSPSYGHSYETFRPFVQKHPTFFTYSSVMMQRMTLTSSIRLVMYSVSESPARISHLSSRNSHYERRTGKGLKVDEPEQQGLTDIELPRHEVCDRGASPHAPRPPLTLRPHLIPIHRPRGSSDLSQSQSLLRVYFYTILGGTLIGRRSIVNSWG